MASLVITLAAADVQEGSWTTIGFLGSYKDRRYGEFELTADMVRSWQRNLAAGVVTGEPNMVAVDIEHAMDDPHAPGLAKRAAGWIREIRLAGDRIEARIEWTPFAREGIENRELRYFSPTFSSKFLDDQGQDRGDTLIGGGLTARPFLRSKGALCVQLAQDHLEIVDVPDEERDPPYWTLRNVSTEERDKLADKGAALPDGSFPIANESDLRNAIHAIGRAKDPARAKAHIRKRAKALEREDLLPDDWKTAAQDDTDWMRLRDTLHEQLEKPMLDGKRKCSCGAIMRKGQEQCPECGKTLAQYLADAFQLAWGYKGQGREAGKHAKREHNEKPKPKPAKDTEFERLHPHSGGGLFVVKEGDSSEEARGAKEKLGADLTEAEIRKFQKAHNLKVDGKIGRQTASALLGNKSASKLETGSITPEQREKLRAAAKERKRKTTQPLPAPIAALTDEQVRDMLGRDPARARMKRIRRNARTVLLHQEIG